MTTSTNHVDQPAPPQRYVSKEDLLEWLQTAHVLLEDAQNAAKCFGCPDTEIRLAMILKQLHEALAVLEKESNGSRSGTGGGGEKWRSGNSPSTSGRYRMDNE
jgi:hypothetical protein